MTLDGGGGGKGGDGAMRVLVRHPDFKPEHLNRSSGLRVCRLRNL